MSIMGRIVRLTRTIMTGRLLLLDCILVLIAELGIVLEDRAYRLEKVVE